MNATERLARDICWAGFAGPKRHLGTTRIKYWRQLSEEKRGEYIGEAQRVLWLIQTLGYTRIHDAICRLDRERLRSNPKPKRRTRG